LENRPPLSGIIAGQTRRNGPDCIHPAAIAGAWLHHPGTRHPDREPNGHRRQRFEIQDRHEKSRLDKERFQNTLKSKPGFSLKFPFGLPQTGLFRSFFSAALCHIGLPNAAFRNG